MSAFVAASGFSAQGRSRLRFVSTNGSAFFGVSARPRVQFQVARPYARTTPKMAASLHEIKMNDINGNSVDFSSMKGKPVLAVNVACFCGYTKKVYSMMKDLSEKYDDKIQVVAFPSNEFGAQEPGTPDEIKKFVSDQYGSKIMIMEKSSVKGSSANEVFKLGIDAGAGEPQWNFDGRLIFDKEGKLAKRLTNAATLPDMDAEIQKGFGCRIKRICPRFHLKTASNRRNITQYFIDKQEQDPVKMFYQMLSKSRKATIATHVQN